MSKNNIVKILSSECASHLEQEIKYWLDYYGNQDKFEYKIYSQTVPKTITEYGVPNVVIQYIYTLIITYNDSQK